MAMTESSKPGFFELAGLYAMLGWRNIWRHPRRSVLTFLAIVLGLLIFIITRAIQFGTYEKIIEKAVRTHTGYIQVHKTGYKENQNFEHIITDYKKITDFIFLNSNVIHYSPRITSEALIASDKSTTGVAVTGIDPDTEFHITTLSSKLKSGRLLEKSGDIMISERMAKNLKTSPGGEIILIGNGADGSLGADRFIISGLFSTGVGDFDRTMVFIHIDDADMLYSMSGAITEIILLLENFDIADKTTLELREKLSNYDMEVHSWKELLPEMVQMITLDNIGGLVMLWFFFFVVIAVILNTILISTLERVREFGIMMALGLKSSRIFLLVLFEAAVLVIIGTIIGVILSWWIGGYMEAHPFGMGEKISGILEEQGLSPLIYTKMTIGLVASWGLAIFSASILVALYPASRVARLTPLKALHPGRGEG